MLSKPKLLKKLIELFIVVFGLNIMISLISSKVQDKFKVLTKIYFPDLPHAEWIILIGVTVILVVLHLFFDRIFNPTAVTAKDDEVSRKFLLDNLLIRYKNRLASKMTMELGLTIDLSLQYTSVGSSEDYVNHFYINNYAEESIDGFQTIYNRYLNEIKRLLIIGEPGAGKTVLLLKFAQGLINEALKDPLFPIPIIVNLSSWRNTYLTFEEWLSDSLVSATGQFGTSKQHALELSASNQLLLLLDGLDEIPSAHRDSCLKKLNDYHVKMNKSREGEYPEYIVCARTADYKSITVDAPVNASILINELDEKKVISELTRLKEERHSRGNNADKLLLEIDQNPGIIKFLNTAFYLHIAIGLADRNFAFKKIIVGSDLVKYYISSELEAIGSCTVAKHSQYLGFIAKQVSNTTKSVYFELSDFQPSWLKSFYAYKVLLNALNGLFLIIFLLMYGQTLKYTVVIVVPMVLVSFITPRKQIETEEIKVFSWRQFNFSSILAAVFLFVILIASFYLSTVIMKIKLENFVPLIFIYCLLFLTMQGFFVIKRMVQIKSPYQRFLSSQYHSLFIQYLSLNAAIISTSYLQDKNWDFLAVFWPIMLFAPVLITVLSSSLYLHMVLRVFFSVYHLLPLKLVTYLNKVATTGLLETDGGQWRFRHQIIQDFFSRAYRK